MGIAEGKKDRVMSKILSKGGEKMFIRIVVFFTMLFWSGLAFGAHPLITDDAGTLGKGKFQLELNGKYDHTDKDGVTEKTTEMATALGYGVTNNMDIVLGIPYQHTRTEDSDAVNTEDGISDASIDLKWRFYERDGFSIALKKYGLIAVENGSQIGHHACSASANYGNFGNFYGVDGRRRSAGTILQSICSLSDGCGFTACRVVCGRMVPPRICYEYLYPHPVLAVCCFHRCVPDTVVSKCR